MKARGVVEVKLRVGYHHAPVRAEIFAGCDFVAETYDEAGATLRVCANAKTLEWVRDVLC
jgi:hypothetical protein